MAEFVPTLDNSFAEQLAAKAQDALAWAEDAKAKKKSILSGISEPGGNLYRINPCLITVDPNWNSRDFELVENQLHIQTLGASIASEGVKVPLTIAYKNSQVILRDGECRLRAVWYAINNLGAEIATVPIIQEKSFDSEADSLVGQFIRNAGKPFTAIESGKHFHRLLSFMSVEEIARRVGQSPSRVRQLLELHSGPEEIKAMVAAGEVSSTQAISTLQACHGNAHEALAVLKKGLENAKKEGKDRLTGKHITDPKAKGVTVKKLLSDIFSKVYYEEDENTGDIIITLQNAEWQAIKGALKL